MNKLNIYELNEHAKYKILMNFYDFNKNEIKKGEILTFIKRDFQPYSDGHTLQFLEKNIYLQEEANKEILNNFDSYFSLL